MVYYEDMIPGTQVTGPGTQIDKQEMVAFAEIWDPMPFHVDEAAGKAAFGSLTASGLYVLAIKNRLLHRLPEQQAVIASAGYDEVRFHEPVRPGDTLTVGLEWLTRRDSKSKPDRGVVTVRFTLTNQDGAVVMSHTDTILVRKRAPAT